jgi:hypothetical protein
MKNDARATGLLEGERTAHACQALSEAVADIEVVLIAAQTRGDVIQLTHLLERVGTKVDSLASAGRTLDEHWEDL